MMIMLMIPMMEKIMLICKQTENDMGKNYYICGLIYTFSGGATLNPSKSRKQNLMKIFYSQNHPT